MDFGLLDVCLSPMNCEPTEFLFYIWPSTIPFIIAVKILLDQHQLSITLLRLAHQIAEQYSDQKPVIIGLQPRGIYFSDRIASILNTMPFMPQPDYGKLDITFYRDDYNQAAGMQVPGVTDIPFSIEGRPVILIDDVLHTGRTIRAAMDALLDFGRPSVVQLMVLIDRRYSRELPVQPDFTGKIVDTVMTQKVKVNWMEKDGKDEVILLD